MRVTILLLVAIVSCNESNQTSKIERPGEPTIYKVSSDDVKMNLAIANAKRTLDSFDVAFKSKNPDYTFFSVKQKFATSKGGEHLWIDIVSLKDRQYIGIIGNATESVKDYVLGDTIKINKTLITDWMYLDKGRLRGGYSIRLLRQRMGENDRKALDESSGIIF